MEVVERMKDSFREKLGDVEEATTPFNMVDVHGALDSPREARETFQSALAQKIRSQARRVGVSPATLFHAAWGLVVACTSGRDDVVYGTVLWVGFRETWASAGDLACSSCASAPFEVPRNHCGAVGGTNAKRIG